jgi:oxygen-dependent protoporphyrinogen oxidase
LVAAGRLRAALPQAKICVLERAHELGGLLAGQHYPEHGLCFDKGTHIFQEQGVPELDQFFMDAVDPAELLTYPQEVGDASGIVFNGRLQSHTHFPDLRSEPALEGLAAAVRQHAETVDPVCAIDRTAPLVIEAVRRFGKDYAHQVLLPRMALTYGRPAEELAAFSMVLPGLTRVVIDDLDDWLRNIQEAGYRAIVGIPDQHRLPAELRHGRRSYYVRHHGSRGIVDAVAKRLQAQGVALHTGASITALNLLASTLDWTDAQGTPHHMTYSGVVLSTGAIGAATLLKLPLVGRGFDAPMSHHLLHFQLAHPNRSRLCYFYALDPECGWYRTTNYRAFSGDPHDRRITVEVLSRPLPDAAGAQAILADLHRVGFLASPNGKLIDALTLPSGFPTPTTRSLQALSTLGDDVRAVLPHNIMLGGIGARPGLFFQNEVVLDMHQAAGRFAEHLASTISANGSPT